MIIPDESASLLAHIDENIMERKEITICNFFDGLLKHCGKILMMDGDVSEGALSLATNYGDLSYVKKQTHKGQQGHKPDPKRVPMRGATPGGPRPIS